MTLQLPYVADERPLSRYIFSMRDIPHWKGWGARIRAHMKQHKIRRGRVAELMGVDYSQVGHWQEGRRDIFLEDFFRLCAGIKADPREILFGESAVDAAIDVLQQTKNASITLIRSGLPLTEVKGGLPPIPQIPRGKKGRNKRGRN